MYPRYLSVSSVGQITLPKSIRQLLGITPGTKVNIEVNEKNNTITLRRQATVAEVSAEMDRINAKYRPLERAPDPRTKYMSVGEMVEAHLREPRKPGEEMDSWI